VLFDSPDRPSLPAHVSRTIAWQSPEAYLRDLAAFIAEQQIRFTYVAQKLRESNRLSESEAATLRPRLQITIQDQRTTRDTTLPALAPLPENVTVEP
jgi:hypothetical protein